jgi:hypothetical protein
LVGFAFSTVMPSVLLAAPRVGVLQLSDPFAIAKRHGFTTSFKRQLDKHVSDPHQQRAEARTRQRQRQGTVRRGEARLGAARQGEAWRSKVWALRFPFRRTGAHPI